MPPITSFGHLLDSPWRPYLFNISLPNGTREAKRFHVKTRFSKKSFDVVVSDWKNLWSESANETELTRLNEEFNPSLEASIEEMLERNMAQLWQPQNENLLSYNAESSRDSDDEDADSDRSNSGKSSSIPTFLKIEISTKSVPKFSWKFHFSRHPRASEILYSHMTLPLMFMFDGLQERNHQLCLLLVEKDKEIKQMAEELTAAKLQEVLTRTAPFSESACKDKWDKEFLDALKTRMQLPDTIFTHPAFLDEYTKITTRLVSQNFEPATDQTEGLADTPTFQNSSQSQMASAFGNDIERKRKREKEAREAESRRQSWDIKFHKSAKKKKRMFG